jgi:hypothetical protein
MPPRRWSFVVLILLAFSASGAETPTIGWQEAVARLAAERTRAETCAALLKKHGDAAAKDQGALEYSEAKAEIDGVIAGLVVALAQDARATPASLPDLEAQLRRGFDGREAFCTKVKALVPPARPGEKNVIIDIVGAVVGPLIEAAQAIWLDAREADRLTAKTIQTQLEATKWPAFASVAPSP